jgi:hypothetical protein
VCGFYFRSKLDAFAEILSTTNCNPELFDLKRKIYANLYNLEQEKREMNNP